MEMSRAKVVTDQEGRFYGIRFTCPGCASDQAHGNFGGYNCLPVHWTPPGMERSPNIAGLDLWTFNGDFDRPTFSPSILTQSTWSDGSKFCCHSFVTDGRIQFLGDCTHVLAGQTVDLPEIPPTAEPTDGGAP